MKRIILSLAILLAAQISFAQEEVAIEQTINQRINKLEISSGWEIETDDQVVVLALPAGIPAVERLFH